MRPLHFYDFLLCAWQRDETHVQVMVQASPAGRMRAPLAVRCAYKKFDQSCALFQEPEWYSDVKKPAALERYGNALAKVILPEPVLALLHSSLKQIPKEDGLRLRLCLDERLMDWPWEYLRLEGLGEKTDYLALHSRISLVREAAVWTAGFEQSTAVERAVFAGTFWEDRGDYWSVQLEYIQLQQALIGVQRFLSVEFMRSDQIALSLRQPASIFYYSGHSETTNQQPRVMTQGSHDADKIKWLLADDLAQMLRKCQTRVSFLGACNSGDWAIARIFLEAGIPVHIGAQGLITNWATWNFGSKLMASLVVGLSLDEAVMAARWNVAENEYAKGVLNPEWGNFMVYMATSDAVIFPRPDTNDVQSAQLAVRVLKVLERRFDETELKAMCFDLSAAQSVFTHLNYQDLSGNTRIEKARELILFSQRHNGMDALIAYVKTQRPDETFSPD